MRPRWEALPTLVALVSSVVALVFNALQARSATDHAAQSRQATQLQLYTTLDSAATASASFFSSADFQDHVGTLERVSPLRARFHAAVSRLDYLAYLFNQHFISLPSARRRWQNDLNCAWILARDKEPKSAKFFWPDLWKATRHQECSGPAGSFPIP